TSYFPIFVIVVLVSSIPASPRGPNCIVYYLLNRFRSGLPLLTRPEWTRSQDPSWQRLPPPLLHYARWKRTDGGRSSPPYPFVFVVLRCKNITKLQLSKSSSEWKTRFLIQK